MSNEANETIADIVAEKRLEAHIKRIHRSIDELVSKDPELPEAEN